MVVLFLGACWHLASCRIDLRYVRFNECIRFNNHLYEFEYYCLNCRYVLSEVLIWWQ
jgi:hypothetical protein